MTQDHSTTALLPPSLRYDAASRSGAASTTPLDLAAYPTVQDLRTLKTTLIAAIDAEISRRQEEDRQRLLTQARAVAREHGLDLQAFLRLPAKTTKTRKPVTTKPGETSAIRPALGAHAKEDSTPDGHR